MNDWEDGSLPDSQRPGFDADTDEEKTLTPADVISAANSVRKRASKWGSSGRDERVENTTAQIVHIDPNPKIVDVLLRGLNVQHAHFAGDFMYNIKEGGWRSVVWRNGVEGGVRTSWPGLMMSGRMII